MQKYLQWISQRLGDETGYGDCEKITEEMLAVFPELSRRFGLFHSLSWGPRTHWWLRTPEGQIVDPTGRQHPDGTLVATSEFLVSKYEDFTDLSDEEFSKRMPRRACLECGTEAELCETWFRVGRESDEGFCSLRCGNSFLGL